MSSFSVISVADLVAWLRGSYVLRPEQAAELPTLQQSFTDTKSITRELVRREWLTPFQSDFVANGRGQQLVLGQYVLLDLLGRGGMGQVFRARHVLMNRIVALKLISPEYLDQPEAVQRFRLEIQAAAQLSHPNIVAALDASQIGDTHILVMEYVEGSDLAKVLARQGKLPVYHSCVYIHQVAAGLQHAHERGLVHRDIKPHNLLLTADGQQVKILDFGLAKFVGASNVPNQRTSSGELGGTVDYLAPEQVTDFHEVDIRADVYSLGCTFYQLLTGRAPFWNIHPMAKSTFHLTKEPPAVETLRPDLPFGLPAVIRRMMSKRPEERYQTPVAVAEAVYPFCEPPRAAPRQPKSVSCRVCQKVFTETQPGDDLWPDAPPICPACRQLIAGNAQPFPGYKIVRELGRGALGVVALALRASDGQVYALKTILPASADNHTAIQRFLREAVILRQLQHPNIVGLRDEGEAGGKLFYAMDYIPGTDLARLLRRDGPMAPARAARLICQILEALAYVHDRGFVHRSINLSDMLVLESGGREKAWLGDFGLARDYQTSEISGITFEGEIGGSIAFMPPEQITDFRNFQPPGDQYAAAASLYRLLTGRYLYDLPENDYTRQLLMILNDDPVPIRKRRQDVPRGMAAAIDRALAREPTERFPDVDTFREALSPFCG